MFYTDSITAIRHPDWLDAVRALEELYKSKRINDKQRIGCSEITMPDQTSWRWQA